MTITEEQQAAVLRLHLVEKWKVGTIAKQLALHHSAVARVLTGIPSANLCTKASKLDALLNFVLETLAKYPTLTASRLYEMVLARGYSGGPDHFRHLIAKLRPKPCAEAFLRLRTLPGEQAQVDWGHFGHIEIGKARRPLMAFVMVLSYSRKIFLHFFQNAQMANFLRGHVAAFDAFGGIPKVLLYDNLKSAVLERRGDAIRFHPELLKFAGHYCYEPRPVAVARGNEKGRVERAIRYIRDSFFAARTWENLTDLNAQAAEWCDGWASNRPCPEDKATSVREVFVAEQRHLIALPANPYATHERVEVSIGKTPYARFDLNDYSLPHTHVRQSVTVLGGPEEILILDAKGIEIARHARSYDRGQQIENIKHIQALVERKAAARQHSGSDHLTAVAPSAKAFLVKAAERHYVLSSVIKSLTSLLEQYGATELELGLCYALAKDVPHPNTVRLHLTQRRAEQGMAPSVPIPLSPDARLKHQVVRPPDLACYRTLADETL